MSLPLDLQSALNRLLDGKSRTDLAARSMRLSENYRAGGGSHVIANDYDALAYSLSRMPATYAATLNVLQRLAEHCPSFTPASLIDAGCGPGTGSWAAAGLWPSMQSITQIDHNAAFLKLARQLAEDAAPPLKNATQLKTEIAQASPTTKADLLILSYALAEIQETSAAVLLRHLWNLCSGAFVVVEPGTPAGYRRILQARESLIEAGAHILAPCPHQAACPLTSPDWCHFSVRLSRSRDHMLVKNAAVPFEDEKFSYLIAMRDKPAQPAHARVIAAPRHDKIGLTARICTPDATAETIKRGKRDKDRFRANHKTGWGDQWQG